MANKHTKRCSTLLNVREIQIKTTVRYRVLCEGLTGAEPENDYYPVRMTIIKKSTNNKQWPGCGEKRTLLHLLVER